jgi:nitric oxide reductase NorE protein
MESPNKSLYYPPGGILLWIIIYLELITFGIAFVALAVEGAKHRAEFHADSLLLNKTFATVNTLVLISSGYTVAKAVQAFKQQCFDKSARFFLWAILLGTAFLVIKGIEYYFKIEAGIGMDYSTFFMFYWLLTGFHWIHVLVGVVILVVIRRNVIKAKADLKLEDVEAGAVFWHMCDIIWLLLFPLLYILI